MGHGGESNYYTAYELFTAGLSPQRVNWLYTAKRGQGKPGTIAVCEPCKACFKEEAGLGPQLQFKKLLEEGFDMAVSVNVHLIKHIKTPIFSSPLSHCCCWFLSASIEYIYTYCVRGLIRKGPISGKIEAKCTQWPCLPTRATRQ